MIMVNELGWPVRLINTLFSCALEFQKEHRRKRNWLAQLLTESKLLTKLRFIRCIPIPLDAVGEK